MANLVSNWIPALDSVENKLKAGGRVADVGCGHGASTVITKGGFKHFRRATETPFNLIYEARP